MGVRGVRPTLLHIPNATCVTAGSAHEDSRAADETERGSAPAEFAMVSGVLVLIFLALLQVAFALHVRNTLTADVGDGARYGARADVTPEEGAGRARELIDATVGGRYSKQVSARTDTVAGARVVTVRATAPVPLVGPWGAGFTVTVEGHAYEENQ